VHHRKTLQDSLYLIDQRGKDYGDPDFMFTTAAEFASLLSGRTYSKLDISIVMEAVKLARRRVSPSLADSYNDLINYTAFSAQFAMEEKQKNQPKSEDGIDAEAKRSVSTNKENTNVPNVNVSRGGDTTIVRPNNR
jgi:hypothetical protein